jgi:ferritin-like metal-binding protein YciE
MFEKFRTPSELFSYKLGSALKMEATVVDMLDRLHGAAQSEELREQLRHHQKETRQQIANLERAFSSIGEEPERHTDVVIEAIDKEGLLRVKRSEDGVVDSVILAGTADTEHHEIGVYDWLIAQAEALGHEEVVELLRENLQQEQHTLEEVRRAMRATAQQSAARAV